MEAPALAELLIRGFEAQLVTHMVARSPSGQIIGGRDVIVNKGDFFETDATKEGLVISYVDLPLGEPGKEQTWAIAEVIEVTVSVLSRIFLDRLKSFVEQYLIRVSVRCPDCAVHFLPTYNHVSRIGVASESWGARERGLLAFGGFSDPALETADERLQLRRPSSVNW